MRTLMPPLWGMVADRVRGPRFWGLLAAWGSVVGLAALHGARGEATMLAASLLYYAFTAPMMPLLDASALAHLAEARGAFGQIRLWGSLGFIVTSFGFGQWVPALPGESIIVALWVAHLVYAIVVTTWPVQEASIAKATWKGWGHLFRLPGFGWLLVALFLNRLAAAPYNGFYTLFVQGMGLGGDVVAWTWGVGVTVEVFVMMVVDRWIDRVGSSRMLAAGLLLEALRWFAYAAIATRAALLFIAPLHGFAFTLLYVASVRRVGEIVPPAWRATGQGFAAAATGLGQMAGFVMAGWLYETAGYSQMFFWGGVTGLVAVGVALRRPRF